MRTLPPPSTHDAGSGGARKGRCALAGVAVDVGAVTIGRESLDTVLSVDRPPAVPMSVVDQVVSLGLLDGPADASDMWSPCVPCVGGDGCAEKVGVVLGPSDGDGVRPVRFCAACTPCAGGLLPARGGIAASCVKGTEVI
jgi:hypothetical protein